jgi:hypothetical protein
MMAVRRHLNWNKPIWDHKRDGWLYRATPCHANRINPCVAMGDSAVSPHEAHCVASLVHLA